MTDHEAFIPLPAGHVLSRPRCPHCGEEIVANACQTSPTTTEAAVAIAALISAAHERMCRP